MNSTKNAPVRVSEEILANIDYVELMNEVLTKPGVLSTAYSKFHNFSFNNQLLAYWQLKFKGLGLSPIASFGFWKANGRHVKKGEMAIWLWRPNMYRSVHEVKNEETNEVEKVTTEYCKGFSYRRDWFSYEQTAGKDFDFGTSKVPNFDFIKAMKELKIKEEPYDSLDGNCQGKALPQDNVIRINPAGSHKDKTKLHEIAHCVLTHDKVNFWRPKYKEIRREYVYGLIEKGYSWEMIKPKFKTKRKDLKKDAKFYERELKECEAETTTFIIGKILGMSEDALAECRGYVQNWFGGKKIPQENAKRIISAVNKMLKAGLPKEEKNKKAGV